MKKLEKTSSVKYKPIIGADYPDPEVIRVDDTYYMLSTTMHFLPGAVILRSYDLINWEIASYVFDTFEGTEEARLDHERSNYGSGMWAGSMRMHKGRFYLSFAAKQSCKTYFYVADSMEGPWEKTCIDSYLHDGSLFFDDDDRVYLVYGNSEIWIRELLPDLTGIKEDGFARKILTETDDVILGHEGSHFYKINGKYYLFTIHWPRMGRRTQMCFCSDSLEGEFTGGTVLNDDMGFMNCGVAQGGIVEANDGSWYSIMLQDHGAVGRVPVLVPVRWENDFPVFGENGRIPATVTTQNNRPYYKYEPLYTSDDFSYEPDSEGKWRLKRQWQWNHEPNPALWSIAHGGGLCITTGKLCTNVTQAVNTLTQRLMLPRTSVEVTVDARDLNEGDFAGLCALQGCYGMIAVTRELRRYYLVMIERNREDKDMSMGACDYMPGTIKQKLSLTEPVVRLRLEASFSEKSDKAVFSYREPRDGGSWHKFGGEHALYFGLDHFVGCRCGLAVYSTKETGGCAVFRDFHYEILIG
ncbi:MAG: family 43 glycosylhydrolase [Acetatifactor sp.]|nr:family 43 glycosylhydrolase [Acetatifactor sp.]